MTLISSANNELGILTAMKRLQYTEGGGDSKIIYDGLDIVKEMDGLGNTRAWYVRTLNIDEPLARIAADGTVRFYHADALGSIIALTDGNGAVRTQYNYSPFGVTQVIGEASENLFQFTARENDGTGLYYYRARYYSPEMGKFISEDPIGFAAGSNFYAYSDSVGKPPFDTNLYSYALNSPTNHVDPTGEVAVAAPILIIGAVVVGTVAIEIALSNLIKNVPLPKCDDNDDNKDDVCGEAFDRCMDNPWQPAWNTNQFGPKKDCGACYRECKHNGGVWLYYKCPE
jgi:RHS repeat-associated protein